MEFVTALSSFCTQHQIRFTTAESDSAALDALNSCTYGEHLHSSIAVFPTTVEQIRQLVVECGKLKEQHPGLAIYPISRGRNWGYGSATPTSAGAVLLSLQDLNGAVEWVGNQLDEPGRPYGKRLGIVRVPANITQQQLYDFLQAEGGAFWMDATGAPTDASIVGNYLERGFGHTAYGDHFRHVVGMEVVLHDGSLVRTGHAGCNNAANIGVHKHGLGPITEGIFSQSGLGVVTAIYLELMPAKKCLSKFFIQLNSDEDFCRAVERLQPLKAKGVLTSQMHCVNDHKSIQAVMRYPFQETGGKTPLPEELANKIRKDLHLKPWSVSGAIYGDSWKEVRYKKGQLKRSLRGISCRKIIFPEWLAMTAYSIVASRLLKTLLPSLQNRLLPGVTVLRELISLKKGVPTNYFMESVYWRKKQPNEPGRYLDPDRDRVGMIWVAPIAPMTKEGVRKLVDIPVSVSEEFGFEPAISITLLNDKAADCILSIIYDREIEAEERQALACYDKLMAQFSELGFTAYRASSRAMLKGQLNYSDELIRLHKKLKNGLDPQGLFSPNHYL